MNLPTIDRSSTYKFYGWRIVAASFLTLGLAVGLPYFGMPFFYDYFEKPVSNGGFGWSRSIITLGLPLGTLATLWVGPLVAHRYSPRRLILIGTGLTALTFVGFGWMNGSVWVYWFLWGLYMTGNVLSGGLMHQIIISRWFVKRRGAALSIAYLGISFVGALSARFFVKPLVEAVNFRAALQTMGCMLFLTWPLVLLVIKERPSDLNLRPDGEDSALDAPLSSEAAHSYRAVLQTRAFWVLLAAGLFSAGSVGVISQHLKLILKDGGVTDQNTLNYIFSQTLLVLLITSMVGRLLVGWMADRFPKRHVMTMTFLLLAASLPFLHFLDPSRTPYEFAILFGLAVGGDFLLVALMTADYFDVATLARALAVLLPVMTVGQTWFPYFIAILREWAGSYGAPLAVTFLAAAVGRAALIFLPPPPARL
jgi:MFS family permease